MKFEDFIEEMKPFHNHICIIYDTDLVRLVGVHNDERDYYYTVKSMNGRHPGMTQNLWHGTAVGHIISLKDIYPKDRYEYMDKIFEWNGATKEENFLVTEEKYEETETNVFTLYEE